MTTLVHLSDLHLRPGDERQAKILASLRSALAESVGRGRADLVVVTGDVFDSSKTPWEDARKLFESLLGHIDAALGPDTRVVVLPGNHDRRDSGVIGPHDTALFDALGSLASPRLTITGRSQPLLYEEVAPVAGLDARLVAYDSNYLPRGYLSAGGWMRAEDLLLMAAEPDPHPDWPLVVMMHHHLIPTPLTDVGVIASEGRPVYQRELIRRVLPALVANGDREELTMTALGAGSALSLLHSLGRPVIVLHGHKHYPTARVLAATTEGEGDIVLASAGSTGTSEPWSPSAHDEAMRLWPSFNVVRVDGDALEVESIAFPPKGDGAALKRRPLLSSRRRGRGWQVAGVHGAPQFETLLALNSAAFTLSESGNNEPEVLDLRCTRRIEARAPLDGPYHEIVEGLQDGDLSVDGAVAVPLVKGAAKIEVPVGRALGYTLRRAVVADLRGADRFYGPGNAFEWVGLVNRYGASRAKLSLDHAGRFGSRTRVFGSITDLVTGRQRPMPLRDGSSALVLEVPECPPRSLLRIHWSLL